MTTMHDVAHMQRRIAAVEAVGSIVHALWALSRAQLPQVEALAAEASVYLDWVDAVVARMAGEPVRERAAEVLFVVLGPERSFSGGLARQVAAALPPHGALGLVGQRFAEAVGERERERIEFALKGPSSTDEVEPVARAIATAILSHGAERHVELLHPRANRTSLHAAVLLSGARGVRALPVVPTYSDPERVLAAAVREAVTGRLRTAVADAFRTEVKARAAAAEAARQAVRKQLDELRLALRTALQEQVTSELVELYAGVIGKE